MSHQFLIVDDMAGNRTFLATMLRRRYPGSNIRTVGSGEEALESARNELPDLILLDANLPGLSGFDVARQLKEDPATRSIMILMISAVFVGIEDRVSGLRHGADSYLCKPFENMELHAQMDALMRIHETERSLVESREMLQRELERRKAVERELRTQKERAEDASKTKSQFLAHMSHELRTPMNGVIGLTDILLRAELTPDQRELVETIRSSGETQLSIINDILEFSKIEAGKLELSPHRFDLHKTLQDTVDLLKIHAHGKNLSLDLERASWLPVHVRGDDVRLKQILFNLLSNAVKFTREGQVALRAHSVQRANGCLALHVAVSDTGIGIPPSKQDRLFQPFSQADASTTRLFGGTGLGLTICKRLTEMMGGAIDFESVEGRGSTFRFHVCLEAAPAHRPAAGARVGRPVRCLFLQPEGASSPFGKLPSAMQEWGCEVRTATGSPGADALDGTDVVVAPADLAALFASAGRRGRIPPLLLIGSPAEEKDRVPALPVAALLPSPPDLFDAWAVIEPIGRAHPDPAARAIEARTAREDRDARVTLKILVAEDNEVNWMVIQRHLEHLGCCPDRASNGREAVDRVEQGDYDVVFMDLLMPEMDGLAATHEIRKRKGDRRPRIIALTASVLTEEQHKCSEAGMNGFLTKPVKSGEIEAVLRAAAALLREEHPDEGADGGRNTERCERGPEPVAG